MKSVMVCFILLFTFGCTFDGQMSEVGKNKLYECTDFRDGEIFTFNTDSIRNVRIGIGAPSSVDIIDESGIERHINSDMNAYLKCEETKTEDYHETD